MEVVRAIPQGRISERMYEQIVDVTLLHILKESVEVVGSIPQERVRHRTVEHSCESAGSSSSGAEELLEVVQTLPREHALERNVEQNAGFCSASDS